MHEGLDHNHIADRRSARGRPSKHAQFPVIIEETTRFLGLHGSAAHNRRRDDVGNSMGVTLAELHKHLLCSVPGLRESGLSRTTVHRLLVAPRQKVQNAKRFKGVIKPRVPRKRNDLPQTTILTAIFVLPKLRWAWSL